MKPNLLSFSFFALLAISWECFARFNPQLAFVIPPLSSILTCLTECHETLITHSWVTFKEMGGAILLAIAIAFPLAWAMVVWQGVRAFLHPFFIVTQCVPMFTLAPLMIFWFGWSFTAIVIPTTVMIFFPLTMTIHHGFKAIQQPLLDFFNAHEATRWQIFTKLQIPSVMPHFFSGLKIATAIAGIGAVAGEWAGGQKGLGILMIESRHAADLELTFGALFCLCFITLSFYGAIHLIENFFKKVRVLSLCLLPLLLLGSCDTPQRDKQVHLTLDWLPNPNHVPLYAGKAKGIFEKYGISLNITKIASASDPMALLTSKQVDLALFYMPEYLAVNAKEDNLQPIAILIQQPLNCFIYRKGELLDIKDMSQNHLGYVVGGFGTGIMQKLLQAKDIHPTKISNVGFDLVSSLLLKQVDIIYGAYWNIEIEHLKSLGIEADYFPLSAFNSPDYYELMVIAHKETEFSKKRFVDSFKAALQESIDFSKASPDEAFELYKKANPDKREKSLLWEKEAWLKTLPTLATTQDINLDLWENFTKWFDDIQKDTSTSLLDPL